MTLNTNSAAVTSPMTRPVETAAQPASAVAGNLGGLLQELTDCRSLRPGPVVDALFGRLVRTVHGTPANFAVEILEHSLIEPLVDRFREICAQGEHELELEWAARICASTAPWSALKRFPYVDNYRHLIRMEVGVLASAVPQPIRSIAFVGSGALPLSSVCLTADLDVAVDSFDRDPDAITWGRRVADRLGYTGLRFHHADVIDADLAGYDVVVVGALVGSTPSDKRTVLAQVRRSMSPGSLLLARSAYGLRTLLYPPVESDALEGFEVLSVIHPVNDIINSAIVARVPR